MALIGLDVGTTGCKCTIFDVEGHVCAYAYKEYVVLNPSKGWFELNPEEVWQAVKCVIGSSAQQYKGEKITALSISSFAEAAVPLDSSGKILYNSLLYTDVRGSEQCERLKSKIGARNIMRLVGLPPHSMSTINKVMWMKDHLPQVYKNVWKFLQYEDFILYKLGKVTTIDYSLAARTMAFNVIKKEWESTIFEAAEIPENIFSTVVPSGTAVSTISREIAAELGLPADLILVTGGHDQMCAAVGGGIIKEGLAIDGMGTVECITPAFNKPVTNEEMLVNNFPCAPHAIKDMYVTYAFCLSGGALLKWYRDNFAAYERIEAQKTGVSVYSILNRLAPKEPTDLLILPHFAGAGTPYMDTAATGAILGLSLNVDSRQIYRGILEGVTYEMMVNLECLGSAGVYIEELRAVGGGSRSDLWLQIKADIMNKKITRLDVEEAGTLGATILAGVATGVYPSIESAAAKLVKVKETFYPHEKYHEIYMENYHRYKKVYSRMKEIFAD